MVFCFVLLEISQSYLYHLQFSGSITVVLVYSGRAEAVQLIHGTSSLLDGNCVPLNPVGTFLEDLDCAVSAKISIEFQGRICAQQDG